MSVIPFVRSLSLERENEQLVHDMRLFIQRKSDQLLYSFLSVCFSKEFFSKKSLDTRRWSSTDSTLKGQLMTLSQWLSSQSLDSKTEWMAHERHGQGIPKTSIFHCTKEEKVHDQTRGARKETFFSWQQRWWWRWRTFIREGFPFLRVSFKFVSQAFNPREVQDESETTWEEDGSNSFLERDFIRAKQGNGNWFTTSKDLTDRFLRHDNLSHMLPSHSVWQSMRGPSYLLRRKYEGSQHFWKHRKDWHVSLVSLSLSLSLACLERPTRIMIKTREQ